MNYYFFAASLPMLSLDSAPPLSWDKFRALCGEHLSKEDTKALDALIGAQGTKANHSFVRDWRERETRLRNAVAKLRAARQHSDPAPYLKEEKGCDVYLEKSVSDAFSRSNPLEREMALDKLRWAQIEEAAGFNPFSSEAMLGYALKLRIAERWTAMNEEEGRDKVTKIVGM
jgi:hypothetical protein